jgi:hypothetical protein
MQRRLHHADYPELERLTKSTSLQYTGSRRRDSMQRLMQPVALRTNSAGADNCVWHAVLPGEKCLSDCTWQHGMVVMINRIILAGSSLRPRQTGWRWWQKPKDVCATCDDAHTHEPASQFEARAQTQSKLRESNTRT